MKHMNLLKENGDLKFTSAEMQEHYDEHIMGKSRKEKLVC